MTLYCKVLWELAPVEVIHEIIEAEAIFAVVAHTGEIVIVEVQHRTMIFELARQILQELVWRVNGGCWCHICFLSQEEVDRIL